MPSGIIEGVIRGMFSQLSVAGNGIVAVVVCGMFSQLSDLHFVAIQVSVSGCLTFTYLRRLADEKGTDVYVRIEFCWNKVLLESVRFCFVVEGAWASPGSGGGAVRGAMFFFVADCHVSEFYGTVVMHIILFVRSRRG